MYIINISPFPYMRNIYIQKKIQNKTKEPKKFHNFLKIVSFDLCVIKE